MPRKVERAVARRLHEPSLLDGVRVEEHGKEQLSDIRDQQLFSVPIEAMPQNIPAVVEVDVSALDQRSSAPMSMAAPFTTRALGTPVLLIWKFNV